MTEKTWEYTPPLAVAVQCWKEIDGPKYGRVVAWRKRCQNKTKDPSGACHLHRVTRTRIR